MQSDMTIQLYYCTDICRFIDEDGYIVDNIYRYITPNMFYLFITLKEYMLIEVSNDNFVELIYPDDDLEEAEDGYNAI